MTARRGLGGRGQGRYTLAETEHGRALGVCVEVEGLFGDTAPATLRWHDAATAREHLSRVLTPAGRPYDLFAELLDVLAAGGLRVTLA